MTTRTTPAPDDTVSATLESPVGRLTIVATDRGVRAVSWPDADSEQPDSEQPDSQQPDSQQPVSEQPDSGRGQLIDDETDHPVLVRAITQLREYFAGERETFDVPLDPVGTEFQRSAWEALRTIPYAETVTYGEQAARMGDRRKARAVGAANGKNPISIIVPCHRVVGSDGTLTGFAGGLEAKAWLLDHERAVSGRTLPLH